MNKRLSKLNQLIKNANLDAVALIPGPSFVYLTGLHFHVSERPTVFLYAQDTESPVLILPELEIAKADFCEYKLATFAYNDNPTTWQQAFSKAADYLKLGSSSIGVEPAHFRVLELRFLEKAIPDAKFVSAETALAQLRMHKDSQEIDYMIKANRIAEAALRETLKSVKVGMDEREIASELTIQILRAGSDVLAYIPIVASGPNSANPHAMPTNRKINYGDILLFDYGAVFNGYCSDITRTFAIGDLDPEVKVIYDTVLKANTAARQFAKPGIKAGEVDNAAREVIKNAGYGQYFIHRTGHGLGMEGHEAPYIYGDNTQLLEPGMSFTIEPGIYLPNRAGVRIEDDVVITTEGVKTLTEYPREYTNIC